MKKILFYGIQINAEEFFLFYIFSIILGWKNIFNTTITTYRYAQSETKSDKAVASDLSFFMP